MNSDMTQLQQVGHVTVWNKDCLEIYWNPVRRSIIIRDSDYKSQDIYESEDDSIMASLAQFMLCEPHQLCADQIIVCDRKGGYQENCDDLKLDIYDCEWSDFACENQIIQFNVRTLLWLRDRFERDAATFVYDSCLPDSSADSSVDYEAIYRIAEALRWGDEVEEVEEDNEVEDDCFCFADEGGHYVAKATSTCNGRCLLD